MTDHKYIHYVNMMSLYRRYLEQMEGRISCERYMLQRSLLDKIKECAAACDVSETDFMDKQQYTAFTEGKKFLEEEIKRTNEILERDYCIRID